MNVMTLQETTLVQRACAQVNGFHDLHQRLEKKILINGKSKSTLANYMRCIAHISLHFNALPTDLSLDQIEDYLLIVKKRNTSASESFFKHTIYGMRFLYRCEGRDDKALKLPALKRENKLPVVLSRNEVKQLLKTPKWLKHRILVGLLYGCGLRCHEVRALCIKDVDFERNMIHVRNGKGNKDRYIPLGLHLARGLQKYLLLEKPNHWLFNGKDANEGLSQKGVQWVIRENAQKCKFLKQVTVHTLRHTYATHLLEDGMDIVTIKELLGHAHIATTMIYLHVAKPGRKPPFSPMDTLYKSN